MKHQFNFCMAIVLILSGMVWEASAQPHEDAVPLQGNLGNHHYSISTSVPLAQQYFDQGLILSFGFNHAEAARSFREAQKHDPTCAMCFWGEALVLGPNINAPMEPVVVPQAYVAVQQALGLRGQATGKERALIQAVAKRYAKDVVADRTELDAAYAEAMKEVAIQFPEDSLIHSLLAEALMDLHPWDFWTKTGEAKPWTQEIVSLLEKVLNRTPNNPLANHLYIHAIEASSHPEKALPSATRLATLVPGSGHLVHMPAHVYIRVGRYHDAALANQQAVKVDDHYLHHAHAESIYTAAYVPHNYHFLWAATIKTGQQQLAMQAAKDTAAKVNLEMMRDPAFGGTLQHFWIIPLYTQALFGKWAAILSEPEPPVDLLYPRGIWHYARGLAFVRQGKLDIAEQELALLKQIQGHPAVAELTIFDLNSIESILKIAHAMLAGEIADSRGEHEVAVSHLQEAVRIEDELNYTEPKDWYLPPRQVLGDVVLDMGNAAEAEHVFREDLKYHPQNGWSLFGLFQSLYAQGKADQAKEVRQAFDQAWANADVKLSSARF